MTATGSASADVAGSADAAAAAGERDAGAQRILDIAFAFRHAKVLLAAARLGVFEALAEGPLAADRLAATVHLHVRGAARFFDALAALGLLDRDAHGRYANAPAAARYLVRRERDCIVDLLGYLDERNYGDWSALAEALRTGRPQRGPFAAGGFERFYDETVTRDAFANGMSGGSVLPARALAERFDWRRYATLMDIGTAEGTVPATIAETHAHLVGGGVDLPALEPAFNRQIAKRGLAGRLRFHVGDFLRDPLPRADVLVMGRVLHDWDAATRSSLVGKAHEALNAGGALIVWEAMIDDDGGDRLPGLLSSLNMLIQTEGGAEMTRSQCRTLLRECGYVRIQTLPLGSHTAIVGFKP